MLIAVMIMCSWDTMIMDSPTTGLLAYLRLLHDELKHRRLTTKWALSGALSDKSIRWRRHSSLNACCVPVALKKLFLLARYDGPLAAGFFSASTHL